MTTVEDRTQTPGGARGGAAASLRRVRGDHGDVRRPPRSGGRARAPARRDPAPPTWLDLAALTLATFKASRTIARDEVTSFVRAPFVEGEAHEGGEQPVATGDFHQAIGELVTCSRCVGTWVAAGLGTTQLLAPRFGRLLTWTLCAAGANDFAQAASRR